MTKLKCNDEIRFTKILDIWHVKFKDFLNEIKGYQEREREKFYLIIKIIRNYCFQTLQI